MTLSNLHPPIHPKQLQFPRNALTNAQPLSSLRHHLDRKTQQLFRQEFIFPLTQPQNRDSLSTPQPLRHKRITLIDNVNRESLPSRRLFKPSLCILIKPEQTLNPQYHRRSIEGRGPPIRLLILRDRGEETDDLSSVEDCFFRLVDASFVPGLQVAAGAVEGFAPS